MKVVHTTILLLAVAVTGCVNKAPRWASVPASKSAGLSQPPLRVPEPIRPKKLMPEATSAPAVLKGENQKQHSVAEKSGASILQSRLKNGEEVVFVPWNGREAWLGATATFRFRQGAQLRLHFFGSDIRDYVGSFGFLSDELIEAKIKSDFPPYSYMAWPRMLLRQDGEDLLLYREDGITWWHDIYPKDGKTWQRDSWPFYYENMEGFWPLRASKRGKVEKGVAANGGRVPP